MQIVKETVYKLLDKTNSIHVVDADYNDNYGLIVLKSIKGKDELIVNGDNICFKIKGIDPTLVRWVNENEFIVVDTRCEDEQPNAVVINTKGELVRSFNCGDGISDIVVSAKGIWVGYFDEGVFGEGISTEGAAFFDFKGNPVHGYHQYLDDNNLKGDEDLFIDDCYAMCEGISNSIWLYCYGEFLLTHWNPDEPQFLNRYTTPHICSGSGSLCVRNNTAYFYGGYKNSNTLYSWEIGTKVAKPLETYEGRLKGLGPTQNNHFINISDKEVSLYKIEG
ncbi:hypothetical protein U8V72_25385 [Priestia filamentosa]|uniref:hypothetical protein n=1 Tax=Priestia filamentosa TaxID=1402861 RepID=UPI00397D0626